VQIDPIKPTLKPPGTERLKLECDILLSTFAFKFNLRRYNKAEDMLDMFNEDPLPQHGRAVQVDPMNPKLIPPGTERLKKCRKL